MISWADEAKTIAALAERQLFFIGGAPRSGTTWLQMLLDGHPEICCRGEGLFSESLAKPLDGMVAARREALEAKNRAVFGEAGGGYPLPGADDAAILLGTAVLLALRSQRPDDRCRAIGEKTPENVFLFPRLKRLFPSARFIGIARDPRDVLTSAWHFFAKKMAKGDEAKAMSAFLRAAIPSIHQGAQNFLALQKQMPESCLLMTYEQMHADTASAATRLFQFLGVGCDPAVVADCVKKTSFSALSGRPPTATGHAASFFRKGVVGDWRTTLTPELNALILEQLGWMFPHFGWTP